MAAFFFFFFFPESKNINQTAITAVEEERERVCWEGRPPGQQRNREREREQEKVDLWILLRFIYYIAALVSEAHHEIASDPTLEGALGGERVSKRERGGYYTHTHTGVVAVAAAAYL